MKKNRSGILLIAEIAVVILFHTFKIRSAEKDRPDNDIVRNSKSIENLPGTTIPVQKGKPEYFFLNMLK